MILKRLGHNVRILERNPIPLLHTRRAGIVAGSHIQELLDSYGGIGHQIEVISRLRHFLDRSGNVTNIQRISQSMTSWDLLYYLLRANFDGLQSEYAPSTREVSGRGKRDI